MNLRSYKKTIAEGKGIFIFAILFAIFIRIIYFIFSDESSFYISSSSNGYLWIPISSFFTQSATISLLSTSIAIALIAFLNSHINTKYVLIRRKTFLPAAFSVLLFSCSTFFLGMSAEYFGVLFILLTISSLFSSYNSDKKQFGAFNASFILTLGSLFVPGLLLYFPILWIGLGIMRCFNFKSFLATILGIIILYFPAFSYYLFTDKLAVFYAPFTSVTINQLSNLPILNLQLADWIIIGFSGIIISIILIDSYINSYKDKIRTRAYIYLLILITSVSILLSIFLNINYISNIYIAIGVGTLILSHFYALAEDKWKIFLFYLYFILYIATCFLPYLPI
ncbi:hypothetical protein [Dysgonomonas sp. ZJ709]|uniref:hypothetical protein n=1 Tax=Dysgonomonas sp. ZJ709 TaxID=2709797 RepID=UPI0013ED0C9B|nr:hypothetical protein [Dysgonomonas sp. ZJ709]